MARRNRHHRSCKGVGAKHGKLYLDFRYRGVRCKEYVNDAATPENRKKWEARCALIKAQINTGTFDYRAAFPNGTKLAVFYPARRRPSVEQWLRRRTPGLAVSVPTAP